MKVEEAQQGEIHNKEKPQKLQQIQSKGMKNLWEKVNY